MVAVLLWFLAVQGLGLLAFPLAFLLFRKLPDRGYTLAKPFGLVLASYAFWILGLTGLIPASRWTIFAILVAGGVFGGWAAWRHKDAILGFVRSEWKTIVAAEALFLGMFAFWVLVTADAPAINHTEKPMDLGFLNAILGSSAFPPEDPWLAGEPISYYYFGHFMMAFLTRLTGLPGAIGYNLGVSLVPALAGVGIFGLVGNLVRLSKGGWRAASAFGWVGAGFLIFLSNLAGFLEFLHLRGWGGPGFWGWVGIKGLDGSAAGAGGWFPGEPWWWWRATRVIDTVREGQSLDYTITEFPLFSFALGDLHPHMLSLAFLPLFLGVVLNLSQSTRELGLGWLRRRPVEGAAVALLLGSLAFINTWDLPVFAAILGAVVFAKCVGQRLQGAVVISAGVMVRAAVACAAMVGPIAALAVALFGPFYWTLNSQAGGVLPVTGPGSRPFLFLLAMGVPVILGAGLVVKQWGGANVSWRNDRVVVGLAVAGCALPLLVWAAAVGWVWLFMPEVGLANLTVGNRLLVTLPLLALSGMAAVSALRRVADDEKSAVFFPLTLAAAAFFLLAAAELFFLLDLFGNRMNTVFKVYYQSWFLLTIAGVWGLYYWGRHWRTGALTRPVVKYSLGLAIAALVAASLYYPVGMISTRTGIGSPDYRFTDKTLHGLAFVERSDPGEYAAVEWLNSVAGPGRIVEAVGNDYSDHGRISASTGRATILGWPGHEQQWRGEGDFLGERTEDVRRIYQSPDGEGALEILKKHDIRYVYVGRRERTKYASQGITNFGEFMTTAFACGDVVIFERRDEGRLRSSSIFGERDTC